LVFLGIYLSCLYCL